MFVAAVKVVSVPIKTGTLQNTKLVGNTGIRRSKMINSKLIMHSTSKIE